MLDIVEIKEGTADALYREVKKLLNDKKIPLSNLVGLAADNCVTMTGSATGFQAQLKADLPDVFVLGCVCYSFTLCASHAREQLPLWLEKFLKEVCSYFARSSKRMRDCIDTGSRESSQPQDSKDGSDQMAFAWYGFRSNIGAVGTFEVVL